MIDAEKVLEAALSDDLWKAAELYESAGCGVVAVDRKKRPVLFDGAWQIPGKYDIQAVLENARVVGLGLRVGEAGGGIAVLDPETAEAQAAMMTVLDKMGICTLVTGRKSGTVTRATKGIFIVLGRACQGKQFKKPDGTLVMEILSVQGGAARQACVPPGVWNCTKGSGALEETLCVVSAFPPAIVTESDLLAIADAIAVECGCDISPRPAYEHKYLALAPRKFTFATQSEMQDIANEALRKMRLAMPGARNNEVFKAGAAVGTLSACGYEFTESQRLAFEDAVEALEQPWSSFLSGFKQKNMTGWVMKALERSDAMAPVAPEPDEARQGLDELVGATKAYEFEKHIRHHVPMRCRSLDESVWYYDSEENLWRAATKERIRHFAYLAAGPTSTSAMRTEIAALIRDSIKPEVFELNIVKESEIAFANGIYDVSVDTLRPHSPDDMLDHVGASNFVARAEPPKHFLSILESQKLSDDELRAFQQYFGYCFFSHARAKKAMFLVGEPNTGKSTILDVLRTVVGPKNCCSLTLDCLGDSRKHAPIQAKTVNIAAESDGDKFDYRGFKNLISGGLDAITIDAKYRMPIEYRSVAKHIFAMNEDPSIPPDEKAVWERIVLIEFKHIVAKINTDLPALLLSERNSIVRWALDGAISLFESKWKFASTGQTMEHRARAVLDDNDNEWFISNFEITRDERDKMLFSEVWEIYCNANKEKPSDRALKMRLKKKIGSIDGVDVRNSTGNRAYVFGVLGTNFEKNRREQSEYKDARRKYVEQSSHTEEVSYDISEYL